LLGRFFKEQWQIRAGDTVEVETLDGVPRRCAVRVGGFSDDLVGVSASMEVDALWRILNEQGVYNFAAIQVDPGALSELYVRLKEMPNVVAVNIKRALYQGLQSTMGTMIRVTTSILISFALAIAGGITTNAIRVSYSERAWELATLRVLGFSQRETFLMLILEVGFQVGVALIPGCFLGVGLIRAVLHGIESEAFGFPVVLEPSAAATAVLVVIAAFAVNGVWVHRLIRKLSLAEALKARD
jgi:putative ABC transport system permease protein